MPESRERLHLKSSLMGVEGAFFQDNLLSVTPVARPEIDLKKKNIT